LFSISLTASREKVENVVNPPQIPVFQNNTVVGETSSFSLTMPTINPIMTAPAIFVIKVNIGNSVFMGIRLIAYLPIAPIKSHK